MAPTQIIAVTPEGVGGEIETVDDAIAEDARLAAVIEVATARRQALKAWTHRTLGRPGASLELDGVGKALVTDPATVARVTDDVAFRAWALRTHPDRTDTVRRVDPAAIERALDDPNEPQIARALAEILDDIPGAVTVDVVVDEKLAADVAKPKHARELDDGRLVDKDTGEVIPGLELRQASQPSPRITPDKDLVSLISGEIAGRLTPVPSLEEEAADA